MNFFKCPKCERRWQYPIRLCPHCLVDLEKSKSEKMTVVASSKAMIPTIMHPAVPYFAHIIEDENNNKYAYKTVKEYKIGEEIKYEPVDDKDAVAIWRIKYDISDAIKSTLQLLKIDFAENSKILILPTLVSPNHAYFRENTSPDFLAGVLQFLFEKKIKPENIKIAAQSFDETPIEASAQKSGLLDVCMKNNIAPLDIAKTNFVKQGNLEISEEITKADIVLNLSILKIGQAASTENIFKVLKKENYLASKYLYSETEIANELMGNLANTITIGEAEVIQRPDKLTVFMGLTLAGKNYLNLDRIFNEISMAKAMPKIIEEIRPENIKTVGREIKEVQYNINVC
ncbi:MAG: hypothetical protein WC520_01790 [Candidatus Paceibacterota bacterium]